MNEQEQLEEIKKMVVGMDAKLNGVISFLRGNELDKEDKGLAGWKNEIEDRVFELEKWKFRQYWFAMGFSAAGVGVWELLKKIIH